MIAGVPLSLEGRATLSALLTLRGQPAAMTPALAARCVPLEQDAARLLEALTPQPRGLERPRDPQTRLKDALEGRRLTMGTRLIPAGDEATCPAWVDEADRLRRARCPRPPEAGAL